MRVSLGYPSSKVKGRLGEPTSLGKSVLDSSLKLSSAVSGVRSPFAPPLAVILLNVVDVDGSESMTRFCLVSNCEGDRLAIYGTG